MTELWLSFLRNYCILKSFTFDYVLLEPFREENFCKVCFFSKEIGFFLNLIKQK